MVKKHLKSNTLEKTLKNTKKKIKTPLKISLIVVLQKKSYAYQFTLSLKTCWRNQWRR